MSSFDVYPYLDASKKSPYVVEVQSDFLDGLGTCVVIPLTVPSAYETGAPIALLPSVIVNGDPYVLDTPKMSAVQRKFLKGKIGDLQNERDAIRKAIDFLFDGF